MTSLSKIRFALPLLAGSFFGATATADSIQLTNGDTLNGSVQSLDGDTLKFHSDTLGDLELPREKVQKIEFGEALGFGPPAMQSTPLVPKDVPRATRTKKAEPKAEQPQPSGAVQDLLGKLKGQGVSPTDMQSLQSQFPLLADPDVNAFFRDRVSGLMTGRLDVQDIRGDAQNALDQIDELEKELGPEGAAALRTYKGILQNFVRQTGPAPAGIEPKAAPQESAEPEEPATTQPESDAEAPASEK